MRNITFIWDPKKNSLNQEKHHISFDEAKTCFYDEAALLIYDPDHSVEEDRFILLGLSSESKLLIVCHCYREQSDGTDVIRIFSARKANRHEVKQYNQRNDL